jgi:hypothetical protein
VHRALVLQHGVLLQIFSLSDGASSVRYTRRTNKWLPSIPAFQSGPQADRKHEEITGLCSQIQLALPLASPEELPVITADLAKYEAELAEAAQKLKTLKAEEQVFKAKLDALEASFAQAELAKIIFDYRCARNPLRLANAMAGLPVLSARVSYQRCSKIKCGSWPRFEFRVVKFINTTWTRRHRYPGLQIVALFDQEIKRLSKMVKRAELPDAIAQSIEGKRIENHLRSYLGQNRRFLRLAIERALNTPRVDQRQLPFMIASNFSRILEEPRTALTVALAEHERIDR